MNECVNIQMQMVWQVIFEVIVSIFSYCESLCCYEYSSTIAFRVDKELIGLIWLAQNTHISHIHILFLRNHIDKKHPSQTSDLFNDSHIVESWFWIKTSTHSSIPFISLCIFPLLNSHLLMLIREWLMIWLIRSVGVCWKNWCW